MRTSEVHTANRITSTSQGSRQHSCHRPAVS
nr:MAG TPA: hypothetical protein [Caudoviricetes sp.]